MQTLFLLLIRGYRLLFSPWVGGQCRFYPTCSVYAEQAIRQFGALKGSWLAARRLGKCHPWHPGGMDHLPAPENKNHG